VSKRDRLAVRDWRAARHVRTMISGDRSTLRTCSITALSISRPLHGARCKHPRRVSARPWRRSSDRAFRLFACGRRHRPAGRPENQTLQQCWRLRACPGGALARTVRQDGVNLVLQRLINDRLMLTRIDGALVHHLVDVGRLFRSLDGALVDELAVLTASPWARSACTGPSRVDRELHGKLG
jgi:hypothetical protein